MNINKIEVTILLKSGYESNNHIINDAVSKLLINPKLASYKINGVNYEYSDNFTNDVTELDILYPKAKLLIDAISEVTGISSNKIRSESRIKEIVQARYFFIFHAYSLKLFANNEQLCIFVNRSRCILYNALYVIPNDIAHYNTVASIYSKCLTRYYELLNKRELCQKY